MIVAVPVAFATIRPLESTDAIVASVEDHSSGAVVPAGMNSVWSWYASPFVMVTLSVLKTRRAGSGSSSGERTLTLHGFDTWVPLAVAVIVAVPFLRAVTLPPATTATEALSLVQMSDAFSKACVG